MPERIKFHLDEHVDPDVARGTTDTSNTAEPRCLGSAVRQAGMDGSRTHRRSLSATGQRF
jgi:hypothetical protein